ncbi:MAG: N-acetylgalactosamine-6-sulfatase, partial [Opitutia bacterium TMED67]
SYANLDIPDQEKGFARMIDYIDKDVGRILSVLNELNIEDNTIVMFSSDNGPHQEGGHQMEFFNNNGPLRGMKRDLYEGGLRVPFLVRWPGKVPAKKVSNQISGFQDIFPTILELAQIEPKHKIDGISMVPTLLDKNGQKQHNYLYWEFEERGGSRAILKGNWKGVRLNINKNPNAPIEIYNLKNDIAETTNLAATQSKLVEEFKLVLKREHNSQK